MEKNENWPRINAIVAEALERAPQEREAFLSEAADPLVRAEVESLLSAYESSLGLADTELIAQLGDAAQISKLVGPYGLVNKLGEGFAADPARHDLNGEATRERRKWKQANTSKPRYR